MQALLKFLKTASTHDVHLGKLISLERAQASSHGSPRTAGGPPRVLIVDDEAPVRTLVRCALQDDGFDCEEADNGVTALDALKQHPFDLVVVDLDMPVLDGSQTLKKIRENPPTPNIKIIMISGKIAPDHMAQMLAAGADDFVPKPTSTVQLQARAAFAIKLKDAQDKSDRLAQKLQSINSELVRSLTHKEEILVEGRDNLVLALAELAALRTGEPNGHLTRMQRFCHCLAQEAAALTHFSGQIDQGFLAMLECCAPLHNIGLVALPDYILQKPGKLEPEERQLIQTHSALGADMLEKVLQRTPTALANLMMGIEIARHHHERFDGTGYPDGLAGNAIPLSARIVAVADVYDALRSRRLHRPALSHRVAAEMITSSVGQFDPALVLVFKVCADRFEQIFRECQ
jgi:response regulator RpfG family c-di-GMP phosphodiesterase